MRTLSFSVLAFIFSVPVHANEEVTLEMTVEQAHHCHRMTERGRRFAGQQLAFEQATCTELLAQSEAIVARQLAVTTGLSDSSLSQTCYQSGFQQGTVAVVEKTLLRCHDYLQQTAKPAYHLGYLSCFLGVEADGVTVLKVPEQLLPQFDHKQEIFVPRTDRIWLRTVQYTAQAGWYTGCQEAVGDRISTLPFRYLGPGHVRDPLQLLARQQGERVGSLHAAVHCQALEHEIDSLAKILPEPFVQPTVEGFQTGWRSLCDHLTEEERNG